MSEYKPHPKDTAQLAVDAATTALASAKQTNRYYVFPLVDRIEIAFGNARHLKISTGEESFDLEYHSAVSLDFSMAEDLHKVLGEMLGKAAPTDG